MEAIYFLSLVHAVFLVAIGKRLSSIGYPGSTIVSLVFSSLAIWALVFLVGAMLKIPVFLVGAGLPAAILTALIRFVWLEIKVQLESDGEREIRFATVKKEQEQHQRHAAEDEQVIGQMLPVKNYVGDAESMLAISDLGKLKEHRIRCRIEGSLVKTLFIPESSVAFVSTLISLQVTDSTPSDVQSSADPDLR